MITRSIGISRNNSPEKYKKKFLEMTSWLLKIIKNEKTAKNTVMVLKLLVMDFSYPEGLPILKSLPSTFVYYSGVPELGAQGAHLYTQYFNQQ